MVQDAAVHGARVQVDATVKLVLLGVKSPEVSSSSCECFPLQHTTVVCGGGGLNKYQGHGADAQERAAHAQRVCRACGHAWECKSPVQVFVEAKDQGSARASP